MRIFAAPVFALALVAVCAGQTTGVPGFNDFTVNGNGSGGTSCVATSTSGGSLTFAVSGLPNSAVLGAFALNCVPGVIGLPGGVSLDLNPLSLGLWIGPGTANPVLNPFATMGAAGTFSLSVSGASLSGSLGGHQFAILNPGYGPGFTVTQAHDVTFTAANCAPLANGGPTSDDAQFTFALSGSFTYYGVAYNDMTIVDNGNVFMGPLGNGDFSASDTEFLSAGPRISVTWGDFSLSAGGSLTWDDSATATRVSWFNIPMFSSTDSNTFCVTMDKASGNIDMAWDALSLANQGVGALADTQLTGIGPGNGLTGPNPVDLNAGPFAAVNPNDAIYEWFAPATALTFDLQNSTLSFVAAGGVGTGPYLKL